MRCRENINGYIEDMKQWYIDNSHKDIEWDTVTNNLIESRYLVEERYDYKVKEIHSKSCSKKHKNNISFRINIERMLELYMCKREELFAYANHMEKIKSSYEESKKHGFEIPVYDNIKDHKTWLSKTKEVCSQTAKYVDERTKLENMILCTAGIVSNDKEKIYSKDKYELVEESIKILEDVLNNKKNVNGVMLKIETKEIANIVNDTSLNPYSKGMKVISKGVNKVDENVSNVCRSLEQLKDKLSGNMITGFEQKYIS